MIYVRCPVCDKIAVVHTRPQSLAAPLSAMGFEAIECSVLNVLPLKNTIPEAPLYILTSVHAVYAVPARANVICVGTQTQKAARLVGLNCQNLFSSAEALVHMRPEQCIHLGGRNVSPAMKKFLLNTGIPSVPVYEALPANALPKSLERALRDERLYGVMCFSARGAGIFTKLALCATNKELWQNVRGFALSPRIAEAMHGLPFASLKVAVQPNRNALLEMLSDEQYK